MSEYVCQGKYTEKSVLISPDDTTLYQNLPFDFKKKKKSCTQDYLHIIWNIAHLNELTVLYKNGTDKIVSLYRRLDMLIPELRCLN